MIETRLDGKRILLTQADVMMGPVFREVLAERHRRAGSGQ